MFANMGDMLVENNDETLTLVSARTNATQVTLRRSNDFQRIVCYGCIGVRVIHSLFDVGQIATHCNVRPLACYVV